MGPAARILLIFAGENGSEVIAVQFFTETIFILSLYPQNGERCINHKVETLRIKGIKSRNWSWNLDSGHDMELVLVLVC